MRGSEGHDGRAYPSTIRPPQPPSHQHSTNGHRPPSRHGYSTSGSQAVSSDVISFSERPSLQKHKRTPGSSSDPMVSYKRVIENEVVKDNGSDVFIRPPKTKVAKSKSDTAAAESRHSNYLSTPSFNKNPKRQKQTKREKSEKLSVSKFPKSDSDRPLLGRRSMTFVVDSRVVSNFPPEQTSGELWREPKTKARSKKTKQGPEMTSVSHRSTKHGADFDSVTDKRSNDQTALSKDVPLKPEVPERRAVASRGEGRHDQWDEVCDFDRDGARNPLYISTKSMPLRPKSAGQLRYCVSDDSDESSLDGEIEIVDIDKELEEDPSEPSPYWSEGQPLQVPEVFLNNNEAESSPPMTSRRTASKFSQQHHQDTLQYPNHRHTHTEPQSYTEPNYHHESRSSHVHDLAPRERHHSGESDLSALSDTVVKPIAKSSQGRRRFMSEPEILREPYYDRPPRRAADSKFRNTGNGVQRKGSDLYVRETSREGAEMTSLTASSLARQSRERLYSDAMERVLSRYSELAVREADELTRGATKPQGVRMSTANKSSTSGHHASGSGFIMPPRKLKPINRQPRNNMNDAS
ncbi:hypothetical protein BaRGS_00040345 [Batillaria attramentaria]|uniref:Uncharacterized protein n=1 Tax=Batillaria attramentaria TaxID=370345 RepID=A0ABD0J0F9_9CAEN